MTSPRIPIFDGHNDVLLRLYRPGPMDRKPFSTERPGVTDELGLEARRVGKLPTLWTRGQPVVPTRGKG